MSSEKDLVSKHGRFTLQRTSRGKSRTLISPYWRQETPQRSASRSKLSGEKKIKKIEKSRPKKGYEATKKMKQPIMERPSPPHNTTQYLMFANNNCSELPSIYVEQDRFKFDFEHHAMAGSMMDLMMNKFAELEGKMIIGAQDAVERGEEHEGRAIEGNDGLVEDDKNQLEESTKSVTSVNNGLDTDFCYNMSDRDEKEHNDPYSHYLRQAEVGEDLHGLVRQLVGILDQRDQQINLIKLKGLLEKGST